MEIQEIAIRAKKIIEHYGPIHQRNKLLEELDELENAIEKEDSQNITEESADCFLVLLQLYLIDDNMRRVTRYKADRTIAQMTEEGEK